MDMGKNRLSLTNHTEQGHSATVTACIASMQLPVWFPAAQHRLDRLYCTSGNADGGDDDGASVWGNCIHNAGPTPVWLDLVLVVPESVLPITRNQPRGPP